MPFYVALIIGGVFALAASVFLCGFILPRKRLAPFQKGFFALLHDFLDFKILILDKILKALYILNTCFCIFAGFFLLFSGQESYSYGYYGYGYSSYQSNALAGVLIMLLGPVLMRVLYEGTMLLIIGVDNLIQINRKMGPDKSVAPKEPAAPANPTPEPYYGTSDPGQAPFPQMNQHYGSAPQAPQNYGQQTPQNYGQQAPQQYSDGQAQQPPTMPWN